MQGNDPMAEAEPDWLKQARLELEVLWSTVFEIGDPTLEEKWDAMDAALKALVLSRAVERDSPAR